MKPLTHPDVDRYRWREPSRMEKGARGGVFMLPRDPTKERVTACLAVVASIGGGWDHISVHVVHEDGSRETPTWADMSRVHRLFFFPNEYAMQLHVPPAEHINRHEHVLHLWRPHRKRLPLPPRRFV